MNFNKKYLMVLAASLLLLSCAEEKREVKNGDVSISYKMSGKGDTTVVLVHGWCIDKEYWHETQQVLSSHYTVVALDLGGHGQSGHNRTTWTVDEYAKDVAAVINTLELDRVVLVGHSMGGDIVLRTTLSMPDKIIGFIGIDNFKDFTVEFSEEDKIEIMEFMQKMKSNFDSTATAYSKAALFPPNYSDTASMNRVIRSIQKEDPVVAIESIESAMAFFLTEPDLLPQLTIPVHLIVSDYTPVHQEKLREYCKAGFSILTINGVGHYPMIEKPAEFNQLLVAALKEIRQGR